FKAAGSDNFPDGGDNPPSRCAHIRDAYDQTLAEKFNMHLDVRRMDHCLVFVNGQYWGVYEYREKVDEDYFDYYYDQQEEYVDNLKYWGGMTVENGSDTAWNNLYNYVVANNMTVPANYQHVTDRLDVMSLIDMVALGLYTVNSDWLNWNTAWWRGRKGPNNVKWKYWLWDTDNIFDLGEDYTGWGNTGNTANPCDINDANGGMFSDPSIGPEMGHIVIFNKLMTNPNFEALYVNRMADLLTGPLSCTNMLNHLDSMVARIQPEMQRQCTRWSGNYNTWVNNVQYLRNQISGRCAPFNSGFTNCYNVTGPYHLAVDVYPPNAGTVTIGNTVTPTNYVYSTAYFGGVNVSFKATADTGYVFSHWQTVSHTALPSATVDSMYFDMGTTTDSVVAVFVPTDSVDLTVYVNPVGAGNITVNGNTPALYPTVMRFPINTPLTISETANTGFAFANWIALHHSLTPNSTSPNITFTITQDDTLVANYIAAIDTNALTVLVNPAGGGNVSVNGTTPGSYPAVLQFADGTPLNIVATPQAGYTFTNWVILHHTLTPNSTSATASFTINTGDTLLANFTAIPVVDTFNLTVLVNPAGGGNVSVNGTTPSTYPAVLQIVDGAPVNIVATQNGG
ncbi:MAG TPA: CotH kinase family protein, partial [Chitinophagales bacterium]|nr:CotH kinase family protein [Chitinophagales bacterium]